MARKNNDNNPLQMKLRVESLPRNVKPRQYYERLMEHMTEGTPLPSSWDVRIKWRNPGTKRSKLNRSWKWQEGDFETTVSDSAGVGAFNTVLYDALARALRRHP